MKIFIIVREKAETPQEILWTIFFKILRGNFNYGKK